MGEPVFGIFALGLDNISWVIVAGIWLYTILCRKNKFMASLPGLKEFGESIFKPKKRNASLDIIYKKKIENFQKIYIYDSTAVV